MTSAAERLRESLDELHAERASAELSYFRRGDDSRSWQPAAEALLSERGAEWLQEARSARELSIESDAALVQQLAFVAAWVRGARARPIVRSLLDTKLPCGSEALPPAALVDNLLHGGDAPSGAMHARALGRALQDVAPRLSEIRESVDVALVERGADVGACTAARQAAETFLARTDDAAQDLMAWLLRSRAPRSAAPLHALLFALRAQDLDGLAKPERRFLRLASGLTGLGFERDLNARVRVERACTALLPAPPRIAARAVPGDVRIAALSRELGVLSDFDGAAAIGAGLAHALVSPALPSELRWPVGHALPEALGGIMLRLRADRVYLRRVEGLDKRDAETLARHGALLLLSATRVSAALELSAAAHARSSSERNEGLSAALSRALTIELPEGTAALVWTLLPALCADLRGKLAGAALHLALREHFDEDWFANPRAAEPLRGACARASTLTAEAFCAELGASSDAAASSLLEVLA